MHVLKRNASWDTKTLLLSQAFKSSPHAPRLDMNNTTPACSIHNAGEARQRLLPVAEEFFEYLLFCFHRVSALSVPWDREQAIEAMKASESVANRQAPLQRGGARGVESGQGERGYTRRARFRRPVEFGVEQNRGSRGEARRCFHPGQENR